MCVLRYKRNCAVFTKASTGLWTDAHSVLTVALVAAQARQPPQPPKEMRKRLLEIAENPLLVDLEADVDVLTHLPFIVLTMDGCGPELNAIQVLCDAQHPSLVNFKCVKHHRQGTGVFQAHDLSKCHPGYRKETNNEYKVIQEGAGESDLPLSATALWDWLEQKSMVPSVTRTIWKHMINQPNILAKSFASDTLRAGYKNAGVWPLDLRPFLERCGTFWQELSKQAEERINVAMPHLVSRALSQDELYDYELVNALGTDFLSDVAHQLGPHAEVELLKSRLEYAITFETPMHRRGTVILNGKESTNRRALMLAAATQEQTRATTERDAKLQIRLAWTAVETNTAIAEFKKPGSVWKESLSMICMRAALRHLSNTPASQYARASKEVVIKALQPLLQQRVADMHRVERIEVAAVVEPVQPPGPRLTQSGRRSTTPSRLL